MTLAAPQITNRPAAGAPADAVHPLVARALALHQNRTDRYVLCVDEYVAFRRDGYLIVKGLVAPAEVADLRRHTEDLMQGRLPEQQKRMALDASGRPVKSGTQCQDLEAPPEGLSPEQKAEYWLRIHMLHRKLEIHERFLLHPRILDVLEALIGPDVLAMQSMLFLKGPGKPGQGYHQDSYYIPTVPDTLCGAWLAIDDVDEENGCMYFLPGSQHEPIYPPRDGYGFGQKELQGIDYVGGVSDTDDAKNDLARLARTRYGVTGRGSVERPALMHAGDVAFFGGHVLHRSFTNMSKSRFRRSFVGHYCNARSFTLWGGASPENDPHRSPSVDPVTGATNGSHILARGNTHLAFALPRFGTPCAALLPAEIRKQDNRADAAMMAMADGTMGLTAPAPEDQDHDHAAAGTM